MTKAKLMALALAWFMVFAILSGGFTLSVLSDTESVELQFAANQAGNEATSQESAGNSQTNDDGQTGGNAPARAPVPIGTGEQSIQGPVAGRSVSGF